MVSDRQLCVMMIKCNDCQGERGEMERDVERWWGGERGREKEQKSRMLKVLRFPESALPADNDLTLGSILPHSIPLSQYHFFHISNIIFSPSLFYIPSPSPSFLFISSFSSPSFIPFYKIHSLSKSDMS